MFPPRNFPLPRLRTRGKRRWHRRPELPRSGRVSRRGRSPHARRRRRPGSRRTRLQGRSSRAEGRRRFRAWARPAGQGRLLDAAIRRRCAGAGPGRRAFSRNAESSNPRPRNSDGSRRRGGRRDRGGPFPARSGSGAGRRRGPHPRGGGPRRRAGVRDSWGLGISVRVRSRHAGCPRSASESGMPPGPLRARRRPHQPGRVLPRERPRLVARRPRLRFGDSHRHRPGRSGPGGNSACRAAVRRGNRFPRKRGCRRAGRKR